MEQEIEKEKLRQEKIELEKRRLQVGSVLNAKQRVSLIVSYIYEIPVIYERVSWLLLSGAETPAGSPQWCGLPLHLLQDSHHHPDSGGESVLLRGAT